MKKHYISFLVVIIFLAIGFLVIRNTPDQPEENLSERAVGEVKIAGETVKVDLAVTPKEQEQGLSRRTALAPGTGMLFVFEKPGKYFFWMKDMNFPIDIIWISAERKVVYIKKNATHLDQTSTFGPEADAKYVLEVVAGFSDDHDLKVGDEVLFNF